MADIIIKKKALPGFQVGDFELNKQLKTQNHWIVLIISQF